VNTSAMGLFYRQVAKDAKKSLKLGALGVLAVVHYRPDEHKMSEISGLSSEETPGLPHAIQDANACAGSQSGAAGDGGL